MDFLILRQNNAILMLIVTEPRPAHSAAAASRGELISEVQATRRAAEYLASRAKGTRGRAEG